MFWPIYRRNRRFWSPTSSIWQDMRRMQRDMDFLLGGTRGPIRRSFPTINAWVNDEGVAITADLPGVDPESIDISITGETLTLSGDRTSDELPEGVKYHRRERKFGEFSRALELPFKVDVDAIDARYENGVLQMTLPRVPEEKPKKITVNAN
jgi:HSP20 family protein